MVSKLHTDNQHRAPSMPLSFPFMFSYLLLHFTQYSYNGMCNWY